MIEVVVSKGFMRPDLGEDTYVLWRLLGAYGSWDEAKRWLAYGERIVGLLEQRPKAVLWHPLASTRRVYQRVLELAGPTHVFVVVPSLGALPKRFKERVDAVTYVSLFLPDSRYLLVERGGRREVVPRDFPYLEEFRRDFVGRMAGEALRRLEEAAAGE